MLFEGGEDVVMYCEFDLVIGVFVKDGFLLLMLK